MPITPKGRVTVKSTEFSVYTIKQGNKPINILPLTKKQRNIINTGSSKTRYQKAGLAIH